MDSLAKEAPGKSGIQLSAISRSSRLRPGPPPKGSMGGAVRVLAALLLASLLFPGPVLPADAAGPVKTARASMETGPGAPAPGAGNAGAGKDTAASRRNAALAAMSREEIYRGVFGKPMPAAPAQKLWMWLVVNGRSRGRILVNVPADPAGASFAAGPVLAALKGAVKPAVMKELEGAAAGGEMSAAGLVAAGLETDLDLSSFRFYVTVPPKLADTGVHSLGGGSVDPFACGAREPDPFSAYLNWSAQQEFDEPSLQAGGSDRGPLGLDLDGAANLKGWVLEGKAYWREGSGRGLSRRDVRLVHDFFHEAIRFSAGDLSFPVSGYASVMNLGGVGLSRDYSLKPHEISYPTSDYSFYLDRPVTAEIWVNGALMQALSLSAGDHDIRNFPSVTGENDVEIRILDAAGRRQTLRFSFIHDSTLLARGKDQFSVNAGLSREISDGDYEYLGDRPGLSAFYRRGLSDRLTLGGFLQALPHQAVAGCEAAAAFSLGTVSAQVAASTLEDYGQGWAGRLSFTGYDQVGGRRLPFRLGMELEYIGRDFARVTETRPANTREFNTLATIAFALPKDFELRLGGGWAVLRDSPASSSFYATGTLSWRYRQYVSTNFSLRYSEDARGKTETSAVLGVSLYFPGHNQSLTTTKAWDGDMETRYDFGDRSSSPGHVRGYVSGRTGGGRDSAKAELSATSNLGLASVSHQISEDRNECGAPTQNQTLVSLQSAFVYVDGNFAVSRPVQGGFVLVKGVGNCEGREISVNPGADGPLARSTFLGPAVLPDLVPYRLAEIKAVPRDAPLTYAPREEAPPLLPTYKSGTALYVGTEVSLFVLGSLTGPDGRPLPNLPVEISFPEHPGIPAERTFTDTKGRFRVAAPGPGPCLVRPLSSDSPYAELSFNIPHHAGDLYRAGGLVLPTAKK